LNLAQCSKVSTVLLATTKPRTVHWITRQRSVTHHSREHVSTALDSSGGTITDCCSELLLLCYNPTNS
ncbi:unnamed protein product, partial [Staurois parvus]